MVRLGTLSSWTQLAFVGTRRIPAARLWRVVLGAYFISETFSAEHEQEGDNDVESGTQAVLDASGGRLPQVSAGGSVQMTLHQVNSDGAGPYTCMIDSTGTGTLWQGIQLLRMSRETPATETTMGPLNIAIPTDRTCTGTVAGQDNVCMVRCQNPARGGPFGGCVPIQMTSQDAAATQTGNSTVSSATNSTVASTSSASAADAAAGEAASDAAEPNDKRKLRHGIVSQINRRANNLGTRIAQSSRV